MNHNFVLNSLQTLVPHYGFLASATKKTRVENIFSSNLQMGIPWMLFLLMMVCMSSMNIIVFFYMIHF